MRCYLKGYYGFKNFGDEILLLGVISYLCNIGYTHIVIETPNSKRLSDWCKKHQHLYGDNFSCLSFVSSKNLERLSGVHKIFGGGEVVTDARPVPYNGRNYLLGFFVDVMRGNFSLIGGIGTCRRLLTRVLYRILLSRASSIVVRENDSVTIAMKYSSHVVQYHDFAYDVLSQLGTCKAPSQKDLMRLKYGAGKNYGIINVTPYLWNDEIKGRIVHMIENNPDTVRYSFSGEIGVDNKREHELCFFVPGIQQFDRTLYSLEETITFLSGASCALATRLHVLLCLHRAGVPYESVVYQEKIRKLKLA